MYLVVYLFELYYNVITILIQVYKTRIDEMEHLGELGSGTCGQVVQMLHKPSNQIVAVKVDILIPF